MIPPLSATRRRCADPSCNCEDLEGIWWSFVKNAKQKDLGVPKDRADYVFRCKRCGLIWAPTLCLADSTRWLAFSRVTSAHKASEGVRGVSVMTYPGFYVEAWSERGFWHARALGFDIYVKGNVREEVATELRKKVHARVLSHFRVKTGEEWTFGDPDDYPDMEFAQGVDPPSDPFSFA